MLEEFISYLETEVKNHSIYVLGGQGQRGDAINEPWIRKREPTTKYAEDAITFWKKQLASGYGDRLGAFDCSGLGMYWLQNVKGIYKSDMTAHGMKGKCEKLAKNQLKKGDWVFILNSEGRAHHIGFIVDDALQVIEARGRSWGVYKGGFSDRWNWYGRPEVFKNEIEGVVPMNITKELRKGDKGDEVRAVQQMLINKGYSLTKYGADGSFGDETDVAVRAFQKAEKLSVDGIVGEKTTLALGLIWGDAEPDYKALYEQTLTQLKQLQVSYQAMQISFQDLQASYQAVQSDMMSLKEITKKY